MFAPRPPRGDASEAESRVPCAAGRVLVEGFRSPGRALRCRVCLPPPPGAVDTHLPSPGGGARPAREAQKMQSPEPGKRYSRFCDSSFSPCVALRVCRLPLRQRLRPPLLNAGCTILLLNLLIRKIRYQGPWRALSGGINFSPGKGYRLVLGAG